MLGLESLEKAFGKKADSGPGAVEHIHWLFWKQGISLTEFNELPIPYILSIVNTDTYWREQKVKAAKKK